MPEETFFASGFGSSTLQPQANSTFNKSTERSEEVSKSSDHNYKDGKQNLKSNSGSFFGFSRVYGRDD